jgi:phage I-like protein
MNAPEWIMLIPAGSFEGRDGSKFGNPYPYSVVAATKELGFEAGAILDFDHATDLATPTGNPTPAAGWMTKFDVRNGAIWAHVEWTKEGHDAVVAKHYRYVSPVFTHAGDGNVQRILRAGLTNSPNLFDTAICCSTETFAINTLTIPLQEKTMLTDEDQKMRWLLGLSEPQFIAMRKQAEKQIHAARAARLSVDGEGSDGEVRDAEGKLTDEDPDTMDLDHAIATLQGIDFTDTAAAGGRVDLVETAIATLQGIVDRHKNPSAAAAMRRITFRG